MSPAKRKWWTRWYVTVSAVVLLLLGSLAIYQTRVRVPEQAEIDRAIRAKDWGLVVSLINRLDLVSDRGQNYFSLGQAYMNSGDDDRAIEAFMEADNRNFKRGETRYYIASLYAKKEERTMALSWLRDALDAGFEDFARIRSDAHFVALRLDENSVGGREDGSGAIAGLDFLLGTWSVPAGQEVGPSTVTFSQMVPGVLVTETWAGGIPGGASGVFQYDAEAQRWGYTYVDGYGRVFKGTVRLGSSIEIMGAMTSIDGFVVTRKIEIRVSGGTIDYVTVDSMDNGRTWGEESVRRLSVPSDVPRPQF